MNFTAQHIRQALIQIAENKGRPHYTLEVVRSVIDAFRAGVHHPLKSAVMSEQIMLPAVKGSLDPRQDELKEFCARAGINRILANISGLHITTICSYLNGNRPLTDDAWTKLSRSFKKAKSYLPEQSPEEKAWIENRARELQEKGLSFPAALLKAGGECKKQGLGGGV